MRVWLALLLLVLTPASTASAERQEYVRVTYYVQSGLMTDGKTVHTGAAACSGWIPLGTQLQFSDGWVVTCEDRGKGDCYWKGWVDVWAPSQTWGDANVTSDYGEFAWVSVVYWGNGPTLQIGDVLCPQPAGG